jgi:hypothetical protein
MSKSAPNQITVSQAAKLLAQHIAQGRGKWHLAAFQWLHGSEMVTDLIPREGVQVLEIYTGTAPEKDQTPTDFLDDLI